MFWFTGAGPKVVNKVVDLDQPGRWFDSLMSRRLFIKGQFYKARSVP